MSNEINDLDETVAAIYKLLNDLNQLNSSDSPIRCRELSLGITNIEQGLHWMSYVPTPNASDHDR